VKKIIPSLSLFVLGSGLASAQLFPPNEKGVTMGHVHLTVRDMDGNKKFWALLGGVSLTIDGTDVMKFPGVFVFMTPGTPALGAPPPAELQVICGCPSDGIEPSVLNHLGFLIKDWDPFIAKIKAAGLTLKGIPGTGRRQYLLFTPDNVTLEVAEGKNIAFPVTEQHFHFFAPAFINELPHRVPAFAMYEWYANNFGGKLIPTGVGAELPGVNMRYSSTPLPTVPTKGRAVDHIGFEVTNLEAYVKKLEASGVKFDKPYSKTRHNGFASAELTDPFGVSIELTEGLNRY
jgi:catechol 2,3-dioxygenase-like lactoylglutathione lyase family enzyme